MSAYEVGFRPNDHGETATDVQEAMQEHQLVVGARAVVHVTAVIEFFSKALPAVAEELARQDLPATGPPITVYRERDVDYFQVTAGFPVDRRPSGCALAGTVLHAGPIVRAVHLGPYDHLGSTYASVGRWFMARGIFPPATMWEQYLVGPTATADPGRWRTVVVFPLC